MLVLAMLVQATPLPVTPTPPPPIVSLHGGPGPMTCPVGGETFSAWQMGSYSTYGERPDGRPYSYMPFPMPIPECPTNKLVVFDTFSADEIARLPAILASPVYRALVGSESAYYRGFWLARTLGRSDAEALGLLLPAIWEVTPGTMGATDSPAIQATRRRYQREFVRMADALPRTTIGRDRLWVEARAANALRQSDAFGEAEAMRLKAVRTLQTVPDDGWNTYLTKLAAVIARRDDGTEPLDMIPDDQVTFVCADHPPPDRFGAGVCARADIATRVEAIRSIRGGKK